MRVALFPDPQVKIPGASSGAFDQATPKCSDHCDARPPPHPPNQGEASFAVSDPKRMKTIALFLILAAASLAGCAVGPMASRIVIGTGEPQLGDGDYGRAR